MDCIIGFKQSSHFCKDTNTGYLFLNQLYRWKKRIKCVFGKSDKTTLFCFTCRCVAELSKLGSTVASFEKFPQNNG